MNRLGVTQNVVFEDKKYKRVFSGDSWYDFVKVFIKIKGYDDIDPEGIANANLILDAFNTADSSQYLPSELLKQRNKLIALVRKLSLEWSDIPQDLNNNVEDLIKEINKPFLDE